MESQIDAGQASKRRIRVRQSDLHAFIDAGTSKAAELAHPVAGRRSCPGEDWTRFRETLADANAAAVEGDPEYLAEALNALSSARRRAFARALSAAEVERGRPYNLRHSFASLLLHEGRSVIYVARQLGHGAQLTLGRYGHVIDELEDEPRQEPEAAIAAARRVGVAPSVALGRPMSRAHPRGVAVWVQRLAGHSAQALCRTRTEDPFLTMEDRAR